MRRPPQSLRRAAAPGCPGPSRAESANWSRGGRSSSSAPPAATSLTDADLVEMCSIVTGVDPGRVLGAADSGLDQGNWKVGYDARKRTS